MHLILDLDDTLINTRELGPYRKTREGREYIAQNPHRVPTQEIHPALKEITRHYAAKRKITILTNSPHDYAAALLRKHGFPDMPIIAAAGKPHTRKSMLPQEQLLIIGDACTDILQAHALRMPSIGVMWGYSRNYLRLAEPQAIAEKSEDLENIIIAFEEGKRKYAPRRLPGIYRRLPEEEYHGQPQIQIDSIGTYIPARTQEMDKFSSRILRYKEIKDLDTDELLDGRDEFYAGGYIIRGDAYRGVFNLLAAQLIQKTSAMPQATIIPAPNSLPEYCYKIDVNSLLTMRVCKNTHHKRMDCRYVTRIYPKRRSHEGGRTLDEQYRTLGLREGNIETDHAIIIDDVTTTGTQFAAIAKLLRHFGHQGPIHCIALAKTAEPTVQAQDLYF